MNGEKRIRNHGYSDGGVKPSASTQMQRKYSFGVFMTVRH